MIEQEVSECTFYNITTGEIVGNYFGYRLESTLSNFLDYGSINGIYSAEEYYINNETPILRPSQSTNVNKVKIKADGIDFIQISNAPDNTIIKIKNLESGELLEGIFSNNEIFVSEEPGCYKLEFTCFPYKPYSVIIYAED